MIEKIENALVVFGYLLFISAGLAAGVILIAVILHWFNAPLTDDDENDDEPNNDPHAFI